jgi:hypothetical protein
MDQPENDNNKANYDEVEAHCKLLQAKLSQLVQHTPAAGTALDDLSDYYERAVQLRVMRVTTLEEEKRELRREMHAFKDKVRVGGAALTALLLAYIVALHPLDTLDLIVRYWSYAAVAALGVATRFF